MGWLVHMCLRTRWIPNGTRLCWKTSLFRGFENEQRICKMCGLCKMGQQRIHLPLYWILSMKFFGDKVLSRRYPEVKNCGQSWPAHSPDLNPCDYFLWGYLKACAYRPKPLDTDMLLRNIKREVKKISKETCRNVIKNFILRIRQGKLLKGRHLENVVYYWRDKNVLST